MIVSGKVPLVGNGSNLRSMSNTENLSYGITLASEMHMIKKISSFGLQMKIHITIRNNSNN